MKRVLTAFLLIPLVVVLILWAPFGLQMLAAWVTAELALYEYLGLVGASGKHSAKWLVLACCAILFAVGYWMPGSLLTAFGIFALILLGICSLLSPLNRVLADAASGFFGLMYVAFPLVLAPLLTLQENGTAQLLFLLAVVWAGDITALYVGRLLGGRLFSRRSMAPILSPNKTWEGATGSMIGSILAGWGVIACGEALNHHGIGRLLFTQPLWYWIGISILLNIAAQIGDLLESAIKRGAGLKDSGVLLPGHGGVLDRVDALLLALPVLWYVLLFRQSYWP